VVHAGFDGKPRTSLIVRAPPSAVSWIEKSSRPKTELHAVLATTAKIETSLLNTGDRLMNKRPVLSSLY
jgi:hypothetical protein